MVYLFSTFNKTILITPNLIFKRQLKVGLMTIFKFKQVCLRDNAFSTYYKYCFDLR